MSPFARTQNSPFENYTTFTSIEFAFCQKDDTVNSKAETLNQHKLMVSSKVSYLL